MLAKVAKNLEEITSEISRESFYWTVFALLTVPLSFVIRILSLTTPFYEVHPLRQAQTALTIAHMARKTSGFWDYSSPLEGTLWNWVREFPIYQWVTSVFVSAGADLTLTARLITLACFLLSVPYFFSLISRVSGRRAARWGTLFYTILPFTVVYSRVCQVDMVSLSLLIIGLSLASKYYFDPKLKTLIWSTATLTVSGLIKLTIWFGPVFFFGLFILFKVFKSDGWRKALPVFLSLSVQALAVGAWAMWAEFVYYRTGNSAGQAWLLGTLEMRGEISNYIRLLKTFSRDVLADWLWIPLLLGAYSFKDRLGVLSLLFLSGVFSIFVFFNVSIYHHYYFLSVLPPVLLLAGTGMVELFKLQIARQRLVLGLLLIIFLNYNRGFSAGLETLFSNGEQYSLAYEKLHHLTDPEDIILPDEFNNSVLPAYHADRMVVQIRDANVNKLNPSVLYLQDEISLTREYLRNTKMVAILENYGGTYLYRLQNIGSKQYNPQKHIAVLNDSVVLPATSLKGDKVMEVNICKNKNGSEVFGIQASPSNILSISFDKTRTEFLLPHGRYLSLPGRSSWGCVAKISFRPPKALRGTLLAEYPTSPVDQRQSSHR